MLDHIAHDTAKFLVLYAVVIIPVAVTLMMFSSADGDYRQMSQSLFGAYRLTLGDISWEDFVAGHGTDHANMTKEGADVWLKFIYISWTVLSAIVLVNLLIAMMGQSFQDVYDDSKRYAQMERARVVVAIEEAIAFPMWQTLLPCTFTGMFKLCCNIGNNGSYGRYVRSSEIGVDVQVYDLDDEDDDNAHSTRMDILNAVRENTNRLDAMEGLLQMNSSKMAYPERRFAQRTSASADAHGGRVNWSHA
jgi:hypothetical protein